MKPSIMRMVLFVLSDGKTIRPAIIHDVHSDVCVSLSVFMGANDSRQDGYGHESDDTEPVERITSVIHDQEGKAPRTWHWNDHQISSGKPSH
jgi:hypothetical protein